MPHTPQISPLQEKFGMGVRFCFRANMSTQMPQKNGKTQSQSAGSSSTAKHDRNDERGWKLPGGKTQKPTTLALAPRAGVPKNKPPVSLSPKRRTDTYDKDEKLLFLIVVLPLLEAVRGLFSDDRTTWDFFAESPITSTCVLGI